jgi:L-lactate dehydrogenase
LCLKGICNELVLTDINEDRLRGEMMDLQQGLAFLRNVHIDASKDLRVSHNSSIIVITAGAKQKPDESRLSLVERNSNILKCSFFN